MYYDFGTANELVVRPEGGNKMSMPWQSTISSLGAAGSAVSGVLGSFLNYGMQKQQFDYQKALQERIFEREDTAVQRRMADLESAGLNKQLAVGSSANSGSVVPVSAPQFSGASTGLARLGDLMTIATSMANLSRTQADIEKTKAETNNIDVQSAGHLLTNSILQNDVDYLSKFNGNRSSKFQNTWIDSILAAGGAVGNVVNDASGNKGFSIIDAINSFGKLLFGGKK